MDGKNSPPKSKLVQDSEGNEENDYPVLDSNKTKIDYPKGSNEVHKEILEEETLQEITENFMEIVLDNVNQNVQEALKKFQDNKNKGYEKTQKKISELIGALNKHQSETENTINRKVNELKMKIDNIKEKVTTIWKTSEKKKMKQNYKTQWKVTPAE
jgi:polyhydroxyalkanoate synthesis regulator phasin